MSSDTITRDDFLRLCLAVEGLIEEMKRPLVIPPSTVTDPETLDVIREQNRIAAENLARTEAWRVEEREHMKRCEDRYQRRLDEDDPRIVRH
jgi:CRISPR/Cas system-associated protein Csm6